ncbi:helix-turn-helix domain-containing protein [Peptostreptococcus faecalis]|uniref:helix-turn-helix domain-containing protein n=1 Tax=Peptostreptococcus faecalis TaxID=2045015 RepID=UPI000C7D81AD|nr:AraC family transcriptional regulator [Peptostreptococcus faecalis]
MKDYIRIINKTEDYIENNLDKKITLKELSKNVNYTEFHFHRIFKSYSKETLNQFINRIKMERSSIFLVVNQKISITDISYRYGYSDSSSYCRAFKKHFGISPSKFRKKQDMTINKTLKKL